MKFLRLRLHPRKLGRTALILWITFEVASAGAAYVGLGSLHGTASESSARKAGMLDLAAVAPVAWSGLSVF
jgi:thiamine monophosphate synthase